MVCTKDFSSSKLPARTQMDLSSPKQRCSRLHCFYGGCQREVKDVTSSSLNSRAQSDRAKKFPTPTQSRVCSTIFTHSSLWSVRCLLVLLISTSLWSSTLSVSVTRETDSKTKSGENATHMVESYIPPSKLSIKECEEHLDTPEQVHYLCGEHPDMIPILMYAESLGKRVCESAFKNEFWNCSDFSILREPNVTKGEVYKESTYVYALSIAVITHSVAKACSQKLLKSCSCNSDPVNLPTPDSNNEVTYSAGCSDNVDYGLQVAETFLSKRFSGRNLKTELIHHNIGAARMLIRDVIVNAPVRCTCHGVSGSCTFQTCHSELPEFSYIGNKIKQKYTQSCKVSANGHSKNSWVSECNRDISEHDLIYREDNDWCVINPSKGSVGVSGRECTVLSDGPTSCENICRRCGKIPIERTEIIKGESQCSFHFCCEIHCTVLQGQRTYHTCS